MTCSLWRKKSFFPILADSYPLAFLSKFIHHVMARYHPEPVYPASTSLMTLPE